MFSLIHTFLSAHFTSPGRTVSTQIASSGAARGHHRVLMFCQRVLLLWQRVFFDRFSATVKKSFALVSNEAGMSTIEYAMGSLAAAALAGVLYAVIQGGAVVDAIEGIITDALSNSPS